MHYEMEDNEYSIYKYRENLFDETSKDHLDKKMKVFCEKGHLLYHNITMRTLFKKGIRPTSSQWQEFTITLKGWQASMLKTCKVCANQ